MTIHNLGTLAVKCPQCDHQIMIATSETGSEVQPCSACGHQITEDEVRAQALDKAKAEALRFAEQKIRDALKK